MQTGHVATIFRYPVKSMAGEVLQTARLGSRGIPGDRAWAVRDEERGGIRGAKRFPELMCCRAWYEEEPAAEGSSPAQVALPDGRQICINDPQMPRALSSLVDSPVSVWPLMPADMLEHYTRGAPLLEDTGAELRRIFGRTEAEPLPDLSAFPAELIKFESLPGTYFDAFPILLMTVASLAHLQEVADTQQFDVRRFRPNLLLDTTSQSPFPERDWVGKRLSIGGAELEVTLECPRCSMTTHPFDILPRDPGIMRTLVNQANGNLGVYANVVSPGMVSAGDAVTIIG
jgi:uncharacterized protein YcbX